MNISRFHDKVLLPEQDFEQILRQRHQAQLVSHELRDRLTAEHALLLSALQQLAVERGVKDIHWFSRTWMRERRKEIV